MLKLKICLAWWVSLVLILNPVCLSLENGLARTPPLGYSTWNFYPHVAINESTCYAQADAIVRTGLRDAGYKVFIVDEPCFTGRDSKGNLIENSTTWPHGLRGFADYLHARYRHKRCCNYMICSN
jgi:alpha-galactosidase